MKVYHAERNKGRARGTCWNANRLLGGSPVVQLISLASWCPCVGRATLVHFHIFNWRFFPLGYSTRSQTALALHESSRRKKNQTSGRISLKQFMGFSLLFLQVSAVAMPLVASVELISCVLCCSMQAFSPVLCHADSLLLVGSIYKAY